MRSAVASPITVEGRLWGAIAVLSPWHEPLPENTEARLADFTELVATAIANAKSRGELAASEGRARKLATEQAALRRVATLAARESSSPVEVLEAVAGEAARVLEVDAVGMLRFDPEGTATLVAQSETPWDPPPLGTCFTLEGENIVASVHRTGQAARMDDWESATGSVAAMANVLGVRSAVASPIVVEGQLWGTMVAATNRSKPLPADTEARIVDFTELLATAIANADSRAELAASEARARELAHEQAALRRVATLVAQGASPDAVFTAVAEEVAGIINTPIVAVFRYESDGTCTTLGVAGETSFAVGSRWPVEEEGISGMILASGRPAQKDDYSTMGGPVGEAVREALIVATVGVPIVVEGSIWGFMVAGERPDRPIPTDTEERLARFTELVATAVSNATMRGELVASRARVIAAGDDARRRIERDLHDGAQQQLVTLALAMRTAEGRIPTGQEHLKAEVNGFADRVTSLVEELREMSRGIHPAILSEGGLSPALEALALRSAVPVTLNVRHEQRLPDAVEVAAYYVASEALANVSKHADASRVELDLHLGDASLGLSIRDDGRGGADPSRGSGLLGLKDRVEALGGTIEVESAHGTGTRLQVAIPVPAQSSAG
jgi:signal transduction histidine kinase